MSTLVHHLLETVTTWQKSHTCSAQEPIDGMPPSCKLAGGSGHLQAASGTKMSFKKMFKTDQQASYENGNIFLP